MTIRQELAADVPEITAEVVVEFGELVELRRQVEHRDPDGSTVKLWRPAGGAEAPFPVIAVVTDEAMRRKTWGREITADVTAIGLLSQATQVGDVLRFREGAFDGLTFEVEQRRPTSIAGITEMALKQVEARDEFAF